MTNIGQGVTHKLLGEKVIAICSNDKKVLTELSVIFKKIGIAPCVFESLEDFWEEYMTTLYNEHQKAHTQRLGQIASAFTYCIAAMSKKCTGRGLKTGPN